MEVLTLGEKIRKRRKELGMTLKEVAMDKVTPGQISLVESGKSNPSIDLLNYLSLKLDISLDYLMESEYSQVNKIATFYSYIIKASIMNKNFSTAEDYITKLEELVSNYNFNNQRLRLYYFKGLIQYHMGDIDKASDLLIKATMTDNIFNYQESIEIYELIGVIFLKKGFYRSALTYFISLEIIIEKIDANRFQLATVYYFMAKCYQGLKNYSKTKEFVKRSYLEFRKNYERDIEADIYLNKAIDAEKSEDDQKAYVFSEHVCALTDDFKQLGFQDTAFRELSEMALENGLCMEALNIRKTVFSDNLDKNDDRLISSLCDYIETLIMNGNISIAEKLIEVAEDPHFEKDNIDKIRIHELRSEINSALKNTAKSENDLILAFNMARNKNYEDKVRELAMKMAMFYEKENDEEEAIKYLNIFMKNNDDSLFSKE